MKHFALALLAHCGGTRVQAAPAPPLWEAGVRRRRSGAPLSHQHQHQHQQRWGPGACFLPSAPPNSRTYGVYPTRRASAAPRLSPTNGHRRCSALSVSKRVDESSRRKPGAGSARKKKGGSAIGNNGRRRMKQSEIDSLVRGIGLEPVARPSATKKEKNGNGERHLQTGDKISADLMQQLSTPSISLRTQLAYSRKGHALLRNFLPPSLVEEIRSELLPHAASHEVSAWRQKVEVQLADSSDAYFRENARTISDNLQTVEDCRDLLESLGVDPSSGDLPFLQHFNAWRATATPNRSLDAVRNLCLSPYLAQTASILMDAPTVRLYQDSLFHKRPGDGRTPWHSDARMAPFDTSKMVTFWIPLQDVRSPEEGGTGLLFADGSHSDFALPYWNGVDGDEYQRLEKRYGTVSHHMPLGVGDVTVHSGWTLHCADAADGMEDGDDRYAFAISYFDGQAELRDDVLAPKTDSGDQKGDNEDVWSFRRWVEEVEPRSQFLHPMVPIVWPPAGE
ncbi:hypothetical protein ACHAXT_010576 [Thalassiosira profunda]